MITFLRLFKIYERCVDQEYLHLISNQHRSRFKSKEGESLSSYSQYCLDIYVAQAVHVSTTKPNRYRESLAVRISHAWSQFHVRLGNVVQRKLWFIHGNLFVHGHANEDDPLTHGDISYDI